MTDYQASAEEKKILGFWQKEKIYQFKPDKKIYSVDTPPPTLSGAMHIGHAFSYSQQDFIVRYKRMKNSGKGILYPFGTDDNGLPTERLVEKIKDVKSKEMSRAEFIKLCLKTLEEIRGDFIQDWKNLGISCDYDVYYSTIDSNSRRISQKNFIDLFKKNLAYQKEFPTIWCPECQTSIAQAELEDKEIPSNFVTIKFTANGKELPIATTRPELLQACVAVFVNPKDNRYKNLKGNAKIPLFNFEVPVIADSSASMEKGTGAMMVCSYGDKYDVDAISKYKLKPKVILNKNGTIKINEILSSASNDFKNFLIQRAVISKLDDKDIKIKDFRKMVIEFLDSKNLLKEKKQITHVVNVHDKCGTEIEFIPTKQWFIKIIDNKKLWVSQGKKIIWFPEHMKKRYDNWVEGLQWDWNISRDRHFGVPIPVWQCPKCGDTILPEIKELPVDPIEKTKQCKKCKVKAKGEEKVLDTWATSSLTPEIVLSLVKNKVKIPFSLRPQAHDIIRTWAFYTIVKSYFNNGQIPWKDIAISGNVSLQGEKMSKSKGNVIDPKTVINQFGADALRFWAASSKLGEDLDYQEKDIITGKKLITKLLNASNFVFMNLKDYKLKKPKKLEELDELFLKELNRVIATTTYRFEIYNYSKAKFNAEEFFWRDFCDNYLEFVKGRVYNGNKQEKESAFYTLYTSLLTILKLLAPIMPFITEYIYQKHFKKHEKENSIHLSEWPEINKKKLEKWVETDVSKEILIANRWNSLVSQLSKIRTIKTENKKTLNSEIILTLDEKVSKALKKYLPDLKRVVNTKDIKEGEFKVAFV